MQQESKGLAHQPDHRPKLLRNSSLPVTVQDKITLVMREQQESRICIDELRNDNQSLKAEIQGIRTEFSDFKEHINQGLNDFKKHINQEITKLKAAGINDPSEIVNALDASKKEQFYKFHQELQQSLIVIFLLNTGMIPFKMPDGSMDEYTFLKKAKYAVKTIFFKGGVEIAKHFDPTGVVSAVHEIAKDFYKAHQEAKFDEYIKNAAAAGEKVFKFTNLIDVIKDSEFTLANFSMLWINQYDGTGPEKAWATRVILAMMKKGNEVDNTNLLIECIKNDDWKPEGNIVIKAAEFFGDALLLYCFTECYNPVLNYPKLLNYIKNNFGLKALDDIINLGEQFSKDQEDKNLLEALCRGEENFRQIIYLVGLEPGEIIENTQ